MIATRRTEMGVRRILFRRSVADFAQQDQIGKWMTVLEFRAANVVLFCVGLAVREQGRFC